MTYEEAAKKYFRLAPGLMVRLKHAYIINARLQKDDAGNVEEIYAE